MSKRRKRIVVEVETDLTTKQIEANGATIYLCEPEGECHPVLELEVLPARPQDWLERLERIEKKLDAILDGEA